jgi:NADPH:quinone reductase-like Zn-dependent oxidoreductase
MATAVMKAAQFSEFGGPDVLRIVDLPVPEVGPGEVRMAVHAVGIGATDIKAREGKMGGTLPQTTGREIAGLVDEVGDGVTDVAVGDRIVGYSGGPTGAGVAQYALVVNYSRLPDTLGYAEAAALPVATETATRGLDVLGVGPGTVLLVSGASGGVGSAATQVAVARGARVIGTTSEANLDYVRSLGAEAIVYGDGLTDRVHALAPGGVDRALDVAGSGILPELIALAGGVVDHVVTLADFAGAKEYGVRFSSGADGRAEHALAAVFDLIAEKRFWLPVSKTFPLDRIADAHAASEAGVQGRVVVLID